MKVLEIASLSREVVEELGKCIFFVKGDKKQNRQLGHIAMSQEPYMAIMVRKTNLNRSRIYFRSIRCTNEESAQWALSCLQGYMCSCQIASMAF